MRFFLLLATVFLICFGGCTHTSGTETASAAMAEEEQTTPSVRNITIAQKKGRKYGVVRLASDSKSPVLAKVPVGTSMRCFGKVEDWYQIQLPESGQLGWIKDVYIDD